MNEPAHDTDLEQADIGALLAEREYGPITREQLQAYAQASGDLNPLHLDPAFARKAGFDDVIVHGMLSMALLGRLIEEQWPDRVLGRFSTRFTGVVKVNQTLRCRARLADRDDTRTMLELEALDADGNMVLAGRAQLDRPRP